MGDARRKGHAQVTFLPMMATVNTLRPTKGERRMNVAVRYYTQTGNTRRLAESVAKELGVRAESVDVPLDGPVDKLFLCNSVYWAGVNDSVKRFVRDNADRIGTIVNVSTAALIGSSYAQMKNVARDAGVRLSPEEFHCRGQFSALHAGHPDARDLEQARIFARRACS
jgi:flavodoxin